MSEKSISQLNKSYSVTDQDMLFLSQLEKEQYISRNVELSVIKDFVFDELSSNFVDSKNVINQTINGLKTFIEPTTLSVRRDNALTIQREEEILSSIPTHDIETRFSFMDRYSVPETYIASYRTSYDDLLGIRIGTIDRNDNSTIRGAVDITQFDDTTTRININANTINISDSGSTNAITNVYGKTITIGSNTQTDNLYLRGGSVYSSALGDVTDVSGYNYVATSKWVFDHFSNNSHTHTKSQITDFDHNHDVDEINEFSDNVIDIGDRRYFQLENLSVYSEVKSAIELVLCDTDMHLYVDPDEGDDNTLNKNGLSPEKPFRSIPYAIQYANTRRFINGSNIYIHLISSGTYDFTKYVTVGELTTSQGFTSLDIHHQDMVQNQSIWIGNTWTTKVGNEVTSHTSNPTIKFDTSYEGDVETTIPEYNTCINCYCNTVFEGITFDGRVSKRTSLTVTDIWKDTFVGRKHMTMIEAKDNIVKVVGCTFKNVMTGVNGHVLVSGCTFQNMYSAIVPQACSGIEINKLQDGITIIDVVNAIDCGYAGVMIVDLFNRGIFNFGNCVKIINLQNGSKIFLNLFYSTNNMWTEVTSDEVHGGTINTNWSIRHDSIELNQEMTISNLTNILCGRSLSGLKDFDGCLYMSYNDSLGFLGALFRCILTADESSTPESSDIDDSYNVDTPENAPDIITDDSQGVTE